MLYADTLNVTGLIVSRFVGIKRLHDDLRVTTAQSLDKLIGSQILDNSKKGLGYESYHDVPPPPTRLFSPPKVDLSNSGLEEFQQHEFERYRPKNSKNVSENISNEVKKSPDAPLVKELANCNYHQRERVISENNYTRVNYNYSTRKAHPSTHRNMAPRAVLMKTGPRPLNTARHVNTAHPKTIVYIAKPMSSFSKLAQSTVKRLYQQRTTLTNKSFSQKVNTTRGKFYTARPNSAVVNVVRVNQVTCPISLTSRNLMNDMLPLGEEQMLAELLVKTINVEEQIQALMDKKKVIITETSIRSDLHLEDAEDEHVTTTSNDPLFSSEDRLKLTELMELYTQLQSRVLALETTKANQALEIKSLKRRVKKLEKKASKKTHKLKRLYKIGSSTRVESFEDVGLGDQEDASKHGRMITDLDVDEGVALVDETQGRNDQDMFDTSILDDEEVVAEKEVSTIDPVPTADEVVTTAGVETSKPMAKGIVMQEPSETPTPTPIDSSQQSSKAKDKGKAKMIKPKKPLKREDQIMIDEEVARNLKAQMQAELEEEERLAKKGRRKLEKGSEKTSEGSSKRARGKLEQEDAKKQRIEGEIESAELKRCLEIIPDGDDDVTIKATPLSSKSPTIADYKIYKEGRKSFFKIIREDGSSHNYPTFGKMFKNFNIEDLEVLWSIVKVRFKKIKPVDDIDNLLFQTLKIMFEHHVEDNIWKYQQGTTKVLNCKLFDSCEVYCVTTQNMVYYLLVEKMYPFTRNIIHQMWNCVRLQVDYEVEMTYDLLRLIKRQISKGYVPE
nr:hypothetical protein [Tanacetum cinerariifolium]